MLDPRGFEASLAEAWRTGVPYGQGPSAGGKIGDDLAIERQQFAGPVRIAGDVAKPGLYMAAELFKALGGNAIARDAFNPDQTYRPCRIISGQDCAVHPSRPEIDLPRLAVDEPAIEYRLGSLPEGRQQGVEAQTIIERGQMGGRPPEHNRCRVGGILAGPWYEPQLPALGRQDARVGCDDGLTYGVGLGLVESEEEPCEGGKHLLRGLLAIHDEYQRCA